MIMSHPELLQSSSNSFPHPPKGITICVFDDGDEKNFQFFSSPSSKTHVKGGFSRMRKMRDDSWL
jgi:hypothetical protein